MKDYDNKFYVYETRIDDKLCRTIARYDTPFGKNKVLFIISDSKKNIYIYLLKTERGYQISCIFIGSPDTGYQLIYLHYQI